MKKLFVIAVLLIFSAAGMEAQNIRQTAVKTKYENIFYKEPSSKQVPFVVDRIVYSTNYKGSESKHIYQVSVYGTVKGSKKQLNHNVQSTDELTYYKNIFNGRYKKILLFEGKNKVGANTYFNTAINVEY